jgi:hypothetical protein
MQVEGKPKQQTEKCEVFDLRVLVRSTATKWTGFFMAIFAKKLPKKGEPAYSFG